MKPPPCPEHAPHYNVDCGPCCDALCLRLDAEGLTMKSERSPAPAPPPVLKRRRLLSEVLSSESLATMRARGGTWAAYECHALDSSEVGSLRCLQVGEGCTFKTAPERWPGGGSVAWSYVFVGMVDLAGGTVQ